MIDVPFYDDGGKVVLIPVFDKEKMSTDRGNIFPINNRAGYVWLRLSCFRRNMIAMTGVGRISVFQKGKYSA